MSRSDDDSHLQLLSVFHFVYGGLCAVGTLLPLGYVILGLAMLNRGMDQASPNGPPPEVGWFIVGFGAFAFLLSLVMAILVVWSGVRLQARTGHTFCMVIAAIECLAFPFGTALGVFTIIVLLRDSVKAQFGISVTGTDSESERPSSTLGDDDYRDQFNDH